MAKSEVPAGGEAQPAPAGVAIKFDKTAIIVSAVVGSLGLLSAILGFAAEGAKRNKASSSVGLGVCAAIFLLITQITVAAIGGCCGCCKSLAIPSETKRIVGVVCAVFSWVLAVTAFGLFLDGAIVESDCLHIIQGGFFAAGGVLTLIVTALGMTSYFMLRTERQPSEPAAARRRPAPPVDDDEPTPIDVGVPVGPGFPPVSPVRAPPGPAFAAARSHAQV
ncbi:uncharacterized protein LOC102703496 [Oryza brachyantha]|uniref:uncharacterized protein LOC102703496 n=1 Tax=Oryza brachyantha TaxID=4533 RepID=UPI001ADC9A09|nr:uncharacterized protein LOC102703496 [Oryza brachyantha]